MMDDMRREEVLGTLDRVVQEVLAAAQLTEPPVDAIALARGVLGMQVCLDARQPQRGRAQRSNGRRQIFLRPEPREERHQWTVAHEIGEHFKTTLLTRLAPAPEETRAMSGESLANLFACHLLVPTAWFAEDAPAADFDLVQLQTRYRTASHEVIANRFLDLPQPCIVTVIDQGGIHRRRSNAWPVRRRLEPPEERCQRQVHAEGVPRCVRENGWTVHGWPVHQEGWQREILRSVVETWD